MRCPICEAAMHESKLMVPSRTALTGCAVEAFYRYSCNAVAMGRGAYHIASLCAIDPLIVN